MLQLDRKLDSIIEQLERVKHRFPDSISLENLEQKVLDGDIQIFPIHDDTVMVGQVHEQTVRIIAAAGRLQDIIDYLPHFCDWYYNHGCTLATLGGRRGWKKYLIDMGWQLGDYDGELVKDLTK